MAQSEMSGKEKSSSFMVQVNSTGSNTVSNPLTKLTTLQRSTLLAQLTLKISAIFFTVCSISVIITSNQSIILFGIQFEASYAYSSSLKFLVGANAVACVFSVLSLISIYLLRRSGSKLRDLFFIFLHDMVMMVLMVSACAAATAVGYVAKHGQEDMTWHSICGYVHKFCNKMIISMAFSYLTFFAYLALTLISAHGLAFPSTSTSATASTH